MILAPWTRCEEGAEIPSCKQVNAYPFPSPLCQPHGESKFLRLLTVMTSGMSGEVGGFNSRKITRSLKSPHTAGSELVCKAFSGSAEQGQPTQISWLLRGGLWKRFLKLKESHV